MNKKSLKMMMEDSETGLTDWTSHLRENMMKSYEEVARTEWKMTYTPWPRLSASFHPVMRCVLPKPDYRAKVMTLFGDDFERLTAQPVLLDDLCMFLLEECIAIKPHIEGEVQGSGAWMFGRWTNETLRTRYIALAEEMAQISALILHYPETRLTYDLECHIQLDWESLYWLAGVPFENTPSREAISRLYVDTVIRDFDRLKVQR